MFSLVITVISIALVAALAIATLYFGGSAFDKGKSRAEASKILLQGQQLIGAADLFYNDNRRWPETLDELTFEGKYLKQVPVAEAAALTNAVAAPATWTMPVRGHPTFILSTASPEVCADVNLSGSLRKRAIATKAYQGLVAQCFGGSTTTLQTVFRKATDTPFNDGAGIGIPQDKVVAGPGPATPTGPDWLVEPGANVPSGGGGGGGGGGAGPVVPGPVPPYTGPTGQATGGTLTVSKQFIDFGVVNYLQNGNGTESVILLNTSTSPVTIGNSFAPGSAVAFTEPGYFGSAVQAVTDSTGAFAVYRRTDDGTSCQGVVPAESSCVLNIEFTPKTGVSQWPFVLQTSEGDFTITLRGEGLAPPPVAEGFKTQMFISARPHPSDSNFMALSLFDATGGGGGVAQLYSKTNSYGLVNYYISLLAGSQGNYINLYQPIMSSGGSTLTYFNCGPTSAYGVCGPGARTDIELTVEISFPYDNARNFVTLPASPSATSGAWCVNWTPSADNERYLTGAAVNGVCPGFQGSALMASPDVLYTEDVNVGSTQILSSTIFNLGNKALTNFSTSVTGDGFSTSAGTCGSTIAAGASCEVRAVFAPQYAEGPGGDYRVIEGTLRVYGTTGGGAVSKEISLTGYIPPQAGVPAPPEPGGPGGGGIGGSTATPQAWVSAAGVNLFEVPVTTPWSGNCGGDASAYNLCTANATRIGGGFSACQRVAVEPAPGVAGKYRSRISCS